ncbi:unnamed protein product [Meloidogyne enterolobii]|uniref:Uncharacterized protein n=1 Tax=Meloidogyne enterolobii TaxID=390850 RepID=A0ACB1APG9_MELEN
MADKLSKINLNLKEDKDEVNKKNKDLLEKNEQLQSQLKNCYKLIQEKNKKICSFEMQAKKLEKEKNDLSIKNVELKTQLVEVYKKIGEKIVRFLKLDKLGLNVMKKILLGRSPQF